MPNYKKNVRTEEKVIVNGETGEIRETRKTNVYYTENEPEYIKVYINDLVNLCELSKGTTNILLMLCRYMNFEMKIYLNTANRREICDSLKISKTHLDNTITKLKDKEILFNIDRGTYLANPHFFGKGKWENIRKMRESFELRIRYELQPDGSVKRVLGTEVVGEI